MRKNKLYLTNLVSIELLNKSDILFLVHRALAFKNGLSYRFLEPKFVANIFLEESFRTKYSFEIAQQRLGIHIINIDAEKKLEKGETIQDIMLTISALDVDAVVARLPIEKYYNQLSNELTIKYKIINAGDGIGEEPAQTLADIMTIYEQFGYFSGLKIGIVGNIKQSRVAHSNICALKKLGAELFFCMPNNCCSTTYQSEAISLPMDELVQKVDVLFIISFEKTDASTRNDEKTYFELYGLTCQRQHSMKPNAIILHTGPVNRHKDIANNIVDIPQSKIFMQVKNSVYMNMAILEAVLQ